MSQTRNIGKDKPPTPHTHAEVMEYRGNIMLKMYKELQKENKQKQRLRDGIRIGKFDLKRLLLVLMVLIIKWWKSSKNNKYAQEGKT